jgi:hypothetical protein
MKERVKEPSERERRAEAREDLKYMKRLRGAFENKASEAIFTEGRAKWHRTAAERKARG